MPPLPVPGFVTAGAALQSAIASADNAPLRAALIEIKAHLGAALVQALPEDNAIIISHLRHAHDRATEILRAFR